MGCLGVHFALTEEEAKKLRAIDTDAGRLEYVEEELEPQMFGGEAERKAESDKAWEAIHRALTDGKLGYDNGPYPLSHVILGGERLYSGGDYVMSLKAPRQVQDAADALAALSRGEFRRRYFRIDPRNYGLPLSEEDCGYSWDWLCQLSEFFQRAAAQHRYVLFTSTQ